MFQNYIIIFKKRAIWKATREEKQLNFGFLLKGGGGTFGRTFFHLEFGHLKGKGGGEEMESRDRGLLNLTNQSSASPPRCYQGGLLALRFANLGVQTSVLFSWQTSI